MDILEVDGKKKQTERKTMLNPGNEVKTEVTGEEAINL